jgi:hypothetical protein
MAGIADREGITGGFGEIGFLGRDFAGGDQQVDMANAKGFGQAPPDFGAGQGDFATFYLREVGLGETSFLAKALLGPSQKVTASFDVVGECAHGAEGTRVYRQLTLIHCCYVVVNQP